MVGLPDIGDEDTGRIRTEISKGHSKQPEIDLAALTAAFLVHERDDMRRWRVSMWVFGLLLTGTITVCSYALSAAAESGSDRATMQDMHARMVRIEGLLMSREERR